MYKIKCPACKGTHTVKNGKRQGVQLYVCKECGYQFRNGNKVDTDTLWSLYQDGKQTMAELAEKHRISQSTIKRRIREVTIGWDQPSLTGSGFLHLDTTYWGHNWGVLLGLDEETGLPLYVAFIGHERVQDYIDAVRSIEQRGYCIRGIVIDGMQSLFSEFSAYKIQMCQFHMMEIVKRYLTKRPKLIAARELKELVGSLTTRQKNEFEDEYRKWKERWGNTLNRRTTLKSGKTQFNPQAAALGNAQRGLLPAIPVHVPAAGMQGNAKYKQQDRRHVHRPEKEPQQP